MVYSTCSVHVEENEMVVSAVLRGEQEKLAADPTYRPFQLKPTLQVRPIDQLLGCSDKLPEVVDMRWLKRLLKLISDMPVFWHRRGRVEGSGRARKARPWS